MNDFLQTLKNLGPVRLAALGAVGVATLLFLVFMIAQMSGQGMSPVFRGLSPSDGGAIVQRLEQLNIPYEASADGSTISVPSTQAGRVKMLMAEEGLPGGGSVGYEIFNQQEGFGTTSFLQNINQQRALEGELARTIRTLQQVSSARVQLVLPRRELFSREAAQSRASVFVELRGTLNAEQISAIQHLVSNAVPQLEPGRVAIIDSRGRLLAAGTGDDSVSAQQASAEEQRLSIEQRLSQRVEEIIGRTVGADKVRAQVSVELDMDSVTTNSETYNPEGQVARSTQSVTEQSQTMEPNPAGASGNSAVSVANNLPSGDGASTPSGSSASTPTSKNNRTEETTNFEISKTIQSQTRAPGSIKRLTVAVLVDGNYVTEGEGEAAKQVYQPRAQQELDQYGALVRSAVGFDANRGDTVEVVNMQFAQDDRANAKESVIESLTSNTELMRLAQMVATGLLGLLVFTVVIRMLVRPMLDYKAESDKQLAANATPQLAAPSAVAQQLEEAEAALEEGVESMIDLNRVDGRVKASSMKKMGEIIDKHPEEAVAIIRQWIYAES